MVVKPYQAKGRKKYCSMKCRNEGLRGNKSHFQHGYTHTSIYYTWNGMINRCYDPRWKDFKIFLKDMLPTYKAGLTIDRTVILF